MPSTTACGLTTKIKMKKVEIIEDAEGAPELIIDGVSVDRHYKAFSPADFCEKAAYLLYRKFGFSCRHYLDNVGDGIKTAVHEGYFVIDGEDATKYVSCLPDNINVGDMNRVMAKLNGYAGYKKLRDAGFNQHYAAETAYNMQLVMVNPDRDQILDILCLKLKD